MFGLGLAAAGAAGFVIGTLSSSSMGSAVGYTLVGFGVVWLLAGGLSGGEYTGLGIGRGIGRRNYMLNDDDDSVIGELRQGYRPEANPRAFWQVIAGGLYVVIGLAVIVLTS